MKRKVHAVASLDTVAYGGARSRPWRRRGAHGGETVGRGGGQATAGESKERGKGRKKLFERFETRMEVNETQTVIRD